MSRTFYSDYVNHCLRFYARHPKSHSHSEADKENWEACHSVLKGYNTKCRELLLTIYSDGDTLADNVYTAAKSMGVSQDTIWKQINELERKVAKKRGLL